MRLPELAATGLAAVGIGGGVLMATGGGSSVCPDGWKAQVNSDEHVQVMSCNWGSWLVVLNPDGSFNYGLNTGDPAAAPVFDSTKVPGWR